MIPPDITLRPRRDADRDFLQALYASTRQRELAPVPWPEEAKAAFLRSQFEAQTLHYDKHYDVAGFHIIERAGVPIGRLYVDGREPAEVHVVDISLLPDACGKGLGTALLGDVMKRAADAGKDVTIHVEQLNPARRLYDRLGFEQVKEEGPYFLMRWSHHRT